jgi:hypothetical protein
MNVALYLSLTTWSRVELPESSGSEHRYRLHLKCTQTKGTMPLAQRFDSANPQVGPGITWQFPYPYVLRKQSLSNDW